MLDLKPQSKAVGIPADDRQQYLLVHADKPAWMIVNEAGYRTFSLCDSQHSVGQVADILSQGYGLPFEQALSDVQSFMSQLMQGGFLIADRAQPAEEPREKKFILRKIDLFITGNCNLHCRHCGVTDGSNRKDYLTAEQIFRIIDQAKDAGAGAVNITGGEPLLREDSLDILSYAAKRVKTALATNATLMTDRSARFLADLGLKIQISLDGPTRSVHDYIRGKGAFARTMRAIDLLRMQGAQQRITVCTTISRNNLCRIPAILELAREKGISEIRFIPLQNMGAACSSRDELTPSRQDYAEFYQYIYQEAAGEFPQLRISPGFQGFVLRHPPGQDSWCQIGQMLIIDARGDLYPCPLLMEPSFRLGNVLETDLYQALESPRMARMREMCRGRKSTIPECRGCLWKNFCQGGCPGSVYRLRGTFQAVDDLCEVRNQLYRQVIFNRAVKKPGSFFNMPCEEGGEVERGV